MAIILGDRVQETSTTTGTGTLSLAGAVSKFRTFVLGVGENDVYYTIVHRSASEWETGMGTVTDDSPDTLSRDVVFASSNSNALVNFSAGTKDVFCSINAVSATLGRGYIDGFQMSNAADTDHDITIGSGEARDSQDILTIRGQTMTKQIDASWAAGTAAGGMFTGSVGNSTWYHVHAIRKDSDGSVDYGFDTSATAANKPSGYTYYRRIGSVLTDGSANIIQFSQTGDEFLWLAAPADVGVATLGTARTLYTLSVPTGVKVLAIMHANSYKASETPYVIIQSPQETDAAPALTASPGVTIFPQVAGIRGTTNITIRTNTSAQIAARSDTASTSLEIQTQGWVDSRGKE